MDTELVGAQKTLSPVLRAKALDNRLPDPILGDTYAEQVMRRLDHGYDTRRFGTSQLGLAAVVRSKAHDDWAREFLAEHPDAVVLHLGCGLDARVHRLDPPATVDWYDLDYPAVIELRRRFLPARDHYTMIGSSVTDPAWLERVPRDRPALMIAEGLVPYLTEPDVRRLLTSVADAFPSGQIQLDTVPVWAWRVSKWDPTLRRYGTRFHCGFDDPAALAAWHPRLRYVGEAPMFDSPLLIAKAPAGTRRMYRIMNLLPGMKRSSRIVRFRF
ncbi:Tetracenomycin polyketide synthesis O-methyltransferase tcmP [[Actinomadura] parvosata subsp. kistnae]|uniref:Methyltransferase n=1 Tax=[Actinomadura] parvosata subsp. kistnae TaxID=1909395 RepID=A0A1U9ZVF0_9ACTN|nr:class I SAM-dependent methyltransferase [Nonomuraea sp. ATCC 55076]AQZ61933.1 methyltransferase [Nonomuraea sp. ATCC 55076]SPL99915.1 Tetracenomycin polyketide synthesis O-methyltransferase tcmP [Actinomadura parvosata subsp. kistnae]